MITGNKGEWSEIYALLKIIADKNLFAGNSDLNKIENLIFPIIKVLRDESNGTYQYSYDSDLVVITGNEEEFRISINEFREKAALLLSKLKESTSSTFSIPEIENFINSFSCVSLKAKSSVKSDIRVVIHDQRTGTNPELGFSIKSQLGKPSTLFNSSQGSNFIYKIENIDFTDIEAEEINSKIEILHDILFCESNPIPVKWCLNRMGLIKKGIRLPLTWMDDKYDESLNNALINTGVINE